MFNDLESCNDDLEKGEYLRDIMIARSTNQPAKEEDYKELRKYFMKQKRNILPDIVLLNRGFDEFWMFIKEYDSYEKRRKHIYNEFKIFLNKLEEEIIIPHSENIKSAIKNINSEFVLNEWNKAVERKENDPDGAITIARTLIESVLKHILDDLNIRYDDKEDLPKLYKKVSKKLNLYPEQHEQESFKKILGSCSNIISEISNIRNGISDAHGKGRKVYKPLERHAEFTVNLSGSMSLFLLKTYENIKIN